MWRYLAPLPPPKLSLLACRASLPEHGWNSEYTSRHTKHSLNHRGNNRRQATSCIVLKCHHVIMKEEIRHGTTGKGRIQSPLWGKGFFISLLGTGLVWQFSLPTEPSKETREILLCFKLQPYKQRIVENIHPPRQVTVLSSVPQQHIHPYQ